MISRWKRARAHRMAELAKQRPPVETYGFRVRVVPGSTRPFVFTVPVGTIGKRARKRKPPTFRPFVSARRQRNALKRVAMKAARHAAHLLDWRDR